MQRTKLCSELPHVFSRCYPDAVVYEKGQTGRWLLRIFQWKSMILILVLKQLEWSCSEVFISSVPLFHCVKLSTACCSRDLLWLWWVKSYMAWTSVITDSTTTTYVLGLGIQRQKRLPSSSVEGRMKMLIRGLKCPRSYDTGTYRWVWWGEGKSDHFYWESWRDFTIRLLGSRVK